MTSETDTLSTSDIAASKKGAAHEAGGDTVAGAETNVDGGLQSLLSGDDAESFRNRWSEIQAAFVDSPRESVERADSLVAELMQRLAQTFAEERQSLEAQLSDGADPSTEDLRVGLRRYRSFFERLLST